MAANLKFTIPNQEHCHHAIGLVTGRASGLYKNTAPTIPKALLLETGLTWNNSGLMG